MDFLRGKHRVGLYLFLLAVLAAGALAAVWSVAGTGAYLTGEGDWQSLAGDYRIGTIDYTVEINDELLLGRNKGGEELLAYKLVVPILAGVRMFDDSTGMTEALRIKEFNEGATLMRVRVTNYSENMVNVTAQFAFTQGGGTAPSIRVLSLPTTLNRDAARTLDYHKYVLDTLAPANGGTAPTDLAALDAAYESYMAANQDIMELDAGLLPGATPVKPEGANVIQSGDKFCYYKDVFLLVWSEYGAGEYDTPANQDAVSPAPERHRQGRFDAVFAVGQME